MQINSYLTFNGNCREAMIFYKKCLGGELTFQTVGESPLSEKMPQQMKDCVLHASLSSRKLLLMGSDMVTKEGLVKGNAVSIMLNCESETEIKNCYRKLAAGGQMTHRPVHTFFNSIMGDLTDKYGNNWILTYKKGKKPRKRFRVKNKAVVKK